MKISRDDSAQGLRKLNQVLCNKECLKFKTLLLLKVVWDPESLFWVLKSEKDFHLKLNLMGSFWRFVFVMHGKHPVIGMFRSETFFYWSQSIPDCENLKGFEWLCFGLHTCFTCVKRECRVWKNLFLTILNPFTSLAFKHILSLDLKICSKRNILSNVEILTFNGMTCSCTQRKCIRHKQV